MTLLQWTWMILNKYFVCVCLCVFTFMGGKDQSIRTPKQQDSRVHYKPRSRNLRPEKLPKTQVIIIVCLFVHRSICLSVCTSDKRWKSFKENSRRIKCTKQPVHVNNLQLFALKKKPALELNSNDSRKKLEFENRQLVYLFTMKKIYHRMGEWGKGNFAWKIGLTTFRLSDFAVVG